MTSITEAVNAVGAGWGDSPWAEAYYAHAELGTAFFWNTKNAFRPLFDRLDLTSVIELACGRGRHAEIVAPWTKRLVLMDIHGKNIDTCRARLRTYPHVSCLLNSGHDFVPEGDGTATAIYCYDAMVHFSPDVVAAYLKDTARVLAPGGMALYHHSNYPAPPDRHYGNNPHSRNHMTASAFAELAEMAGLSVVEQHVMDWDEAKDLDCLSLVRR